MTIALPNTAAGGAKHGGHRRTIAQMQDASRRVRARVNCCTAVLGFGIEVLVFAGLCDRRRLSLPTRDQYGREHRQRDIMFDLVRLAKMAAAGTNSGMT
jgi:hypothetical protein